MIRSGLTALDTALKGGLVTPCLVELYGASDSGKTALALWYVRVAQEDPETVCGWVCAEQNLRPANLEWAEVDSSRLAVVRQTPSLPGLEAAVQLIESGCSLVVVDSIAALIGEGIDSPLHLVLGNGLEKVRIAARAHNAGVLLTNQERGLEMSRKRTQCGSGFALVRDMDYRIGLRPGEGIYRAGIQRGYRVHFEVTKPSDLFTTGRFNLHVDRGLYDLRGTQVPPGEENGDTGEV